MSEGAQAGKEISNLWALRSGKNLGGKFTIDKNIRMTESKRFQVSKRINGKRIWKMFDDLVKAKEWRDRSIDE